MDQYQQLILKQKKFFRTGKTKDLPFRLNALNKLYQAVQHYEQDIISALKKDLNKSTFESYSSEVGMILKDISFVKSKLKNWAKPKRVKTAMTHFGSAGYIYPEPHGLVLIISPWNYPFQLALSPLVGAIAAGNCVILKLSEYSPATSEIIAKIIKELFPEEFVAVVLGGPEVSESLLKEKVDYIFFTGSTQVGKKVMQAASVNLTPLTLELGGKSPCVIHKDASLKIAAKRIAWGKFMNAGQTCVAPDYLYVHNDIKLEFMNYLKEAIKELYGESPLLNTNYTRIVSLRHFNRIKGFLDEEKIIFGGKFSDDNSLIIEPTLLDNIGWNDPVMEDEIFGPVLPILGYSDFNEVINSIQAQPNPLAFYLFTNSKSLQASALKEISFGGGCINDTIYHMVSPYLPFGGKGHSGLGAYHGKSSFDTFSHFKSILKQTVMFDLPFRYPNLKNGIKWVKMFLN